MLEPKEWRSQASLTVPRHFMTLRVPAVIPSWARGSADLQTTSLLIVTSPSSSADAWDLFSSSANGSGWIYPDQQVTRKLVEAFRQVPEVKSICALFRPHEIAIWTLLDGPDGAVREKIYEKELQIGRLFRLRDFDFRVTSVDLVSASELKKTGFIEIYRRD